MLSIVHGSVVDQHVDAIVNAANSGLMGGGGVDGAIHRAAGPGLDQECRRLHDQGGCPTGEARLTGAYGITWARHIVHTVGPVYLARSSQECARELANCYTNSCELAMRAGDTSIAFPAVSCGVYGYPFDEALPVALRALKPYVGKFQRVVLAMFTLQQFDEACQIAPEIARCQRKGDELEVLL
ncbi:MAG: macro domain-containing protein [Atopobiaceae bacterium]